MGKKMRRIQLSLDEDLLSKVDTIIKDLNTSRTDFVRKALISAVEQYNTRCLEEKHRQGYEVNPVIGNEFSIWKKEQVW